MGNAGLDDIKQKTATLMFPKMIPEEGETVYLNGGWGNKNFVQMKKENGKFYGRENSEGIDDKKDEWEDWNVMPIIKGFIDSALGK